MYWYTRTCPEYEPLSPFPGAPIATLEPSPETLTLYPELSPPVSPSISLPNPVHCGGVTKSVAVVEAGAYKYVPSSAAASNTLICVVPSPKIVTSPDEEFTVATDELLLVKDTTPTPRFVNVGCNINGELVMLLIIFAKDITGVIVDFLGIMLDKPSLTTVINPPA